MNLDLPPINPAADMPVNTGEQALAELSDLSLPIGKKVTALFLVQIGDLRHERNRIVAENFRNHERLIIEKATLVSENKALKKYKVAHGRLHSARAETAVASFTSLLFSGGGAAMMGIWPRTETSMPWQFVVGGAAVTFAVILGLLSRIFSLGLRKICPSAIDDGMTKDDD
jgi:hypothetical protein